MHTHTLSLPLPQVQYLHLALLVDPSLYFTTIAFNSKPFIKENVRETHSSYLLLRGMKKMRIRGRGVYNKKTYKQKKLPKAHP